MLQNTEHPGYQNFFMPLGAPRRMTDCPENRRGFLCEPLRLCVEWPSRGTKYFHGLVCGAGSTSRMGLAKAGRTSASEKAAAISSRVTRLINCLESLMIIFPSFFPPGLTQDLNFCIAGDANHAPQRHRQPARGTSEHSTKSSLHRVDALLGFVPDIVGDGDCSITDFLAGILGVLRRGDGALIRFVIDSERQRLRMAAQ